MVSPDKNIVAALRISVGIDLQEGLSINELRNIIGGYINSLISNNFNKLISILYRLDINESKLKQLLATNAGEDAGMIIAELIIERQLQKIKTRSENNNNNIIPDDDRW